MDFLQLLDSHYQKYESSCSPSLIEILLKSEGLVPLDWFEEQKKHKGENVGLKPYLNQTLYGATIRRVQDAPIPANSLVERIDYLLAQGKALGIYLPNLDDSGSSHGWAIYGIENGNYVAGSKNWDSRTGIGRETEVVEIEPAYLKRLPDIDCIYLEVK